MFSENVFAGAKLIDSLPLSQSCTPAQAVALKATGVDGVIGYLGAMNAARLAVILSAGLGFFPVTFAGEYKDGAADEIAQLTALGIPAFATPRVGVALDLEGLDAWNTPADKLISLIEAWAADINKAGYMAILYVGAPQPLTGKQLYSLKGITRYWLGQGRCVGKDMLDAYPDCGWCVRQDWHGNPDLAQHHLKGGMLWPPVAMYPAVPMSSRTFVDTNGVQADHKGRLPTWVRQ